MLPQHIAEPEQAEIILISPAPAPIRPNGLIEFIKADLATMDDTTRKTWRRIWRETMAVEMGARFGAVRGAQTRVDPFRPWWTQWSAMELEAARQWLISQVCR